MKGALGSVVMLLLMAILLGWVATSGSSIRFGF